MSIKVAINGFGRIGRLAFRRMFSSNDFDIIAINDITSTDVLAYLLKYDSTQGTYALAEAVEYDDGSLLVDEKKIKVLKETDAGKLPWRDLDIDVVLECSGAYLSKEKSQAHIDAGAKKVVISAPAGIDIPTIVYGVNEAVLTSKDNIISAASCSTNALAPMVKVLHKLVPIQSGIMTVVHGYTATQMLQDSPQRKGNLRRSRAAAVNIVPSTAEAAKAVGRVIPELNGKLTGSAVRVPVPVGVFINFVAVVKGKNITEETINSAMKEASSEIFFYTEEEYVSSDIVGLTSASMFDATQTLVNKIDDETYQVRLAAWFDNESSFTCQMLRTTQYAAGLS